jgi:DNA-binding PadR family transcriptional regulator
MTVTRLLVLGAVRIFQPAHGYLVRRELISWQADQWAHLNPGSVYNALRTLTRDGLLAEETTDVAIGGTGPSARATYRLTSDGEAEFLLLVRTALWHVHPFEPGWLAAGVSFWAALTRDEVIDALASRRARLAAELPLIGHNIRTVLETPSKPDHVAEHFRIVAALTESEIGWVDDVTQRLRDGAYAFAGEPEIDDATGRRRDGMDLSALHPEPDSHS